MCLFFVCMLFAASVAAVAVAAVMFSSFVPPADIKQGHRTHPSRFFAAPSLQLSFLGGVVA